MDGIMLYLPKRRESKISSNSEHQPLMASRSTWQPKQGSWLSYPHQCYGGVTQLFLKVSEILKSGTMPDIHA